MSATIKDDQHQHTVRRLNSYMRYFDGIYPGVWRKVGRVRAEALKLWPAYCYIPLGYAMKTIVDYRNDIADLELGSLVRQQRQKLEHFCLHAAILQAFAAWRTTRGIYAFDPDLFTALCDTPLSSDDVVPAETFLELPEWSCYLDFSRCRSDCRNGMLGAWVCLEHNPNLLHNELRFIIDYGQALVPLEFFLAPGQTLTGATRSPIGMTEVALATAREHGVSVPPELLELSVREPTDMNTVLPLLSAALYICAEYADIQSANNSTDQLPRKWDVGRRVGNILHQTDQGGGSLASDCSGHWYSYWCDQTKTRRRVLQWRHPMLVRD